MDSTALIQIENNTRENIIIRPMVRSDLPALEWEGEYQHFRNLFADVYEKVQAGISRAWVVVNEENYMIGQVFLQLRSDRLELADGWNRGYLYSLRIRPAYRNLGIGSRLVKVVHDFLVQEGFTRVTLNVARDNLAAIRLYHRFGYKIVAEEPGIWSYPDDEGLWQTINEPSWRMENLLPIA
jgi:ribosomal protein S18 acetylase RimI-like enzyme